MSLALPPHLSVLAKDWSTRDLVRVPGLISLSRVGLAAVFPLTTGHPGWSLAVLGAAGASDLLDGWYARRFHEESATGAALDGLTDKVFVLTVAGTLLASGALAGIELALLGAREIGELALAVRLSVGGTRPRAPGRANAAGKIATTLQYAAIVAVLLESAGRATLIGAAALAGVVASASYWNRLVRTDPKGRR